MTSFIVLGCILKYKKGEIFPVKAVHYCETKKSVTHRNYMKLFVQYHSLDISIVNTSTRINLL